MSYSVQARGRIFVKGYVFLSFARDIGKTIGKDITKNLSSKYRNLLIMLNNLPQIHLNLLQ